MAVCSARGRLFLFDVALVPLCIAVANGALSVGPVYVCVSVSASVNVSASVIVPVGLCEQYSNVRCLNIQRARRRSSIWSYPKPWVSGPTLCGHPAGQVISVAATTPRYSSHPVPPRVYCRELALTMQSGSSRLLLHPNRGPAVLVQICLKSALGPLPPPSLSASLAAFPIGSSALHAAFGMGLGLGVGTVGEDTLSMTVIIRLRLHMMEVCVHCTGQQVVGQQQASVVS